MIRRTLPVLATLTILFAAQPAGAVKSTQKPGAPSKLGEQATFARPNARELLLEAKELWHVKTDYTGALAKFNEAIDAEPKDNDARLQRAHFLEMLAVIVVPSDKAEFKMRAQSDYEQIAANDPDSVIAGMARDGLTRLAGGSLFAPKRVTCPKDAAEARARASSLAGARRFPEAAVEFEKAAAGCPEDVTTWVSFADSYYDMDDFGRAKELFVKALSVDPWNREAHRYLSDTELQLKNIDGAVHQLVLAVLSDPTYEAGWAALRSYTDAMDRKWNRVYGDRRERPGHADGASWEVYEAVKAKARDAHPGSGSALAIEREAVKAALQKARATESANAPGPGSFWSMMARADQAGFLDEAIFIHMPDAQLAAEYPAFREANAERLASYLKTVILSEGLPPAPDVQNSGS
jgi:tetratricopeptide (TPR) repeat protein